MFYTWIQVVGNNDLFINLYQVKANLPDKGLFLFNYTSRNISRIYPNIIADADQLVAAFILDEKIYGCYNKLYDSSKLIANQSDPTVSKY